MEKYATDVEVRNPMSLFGVSLVWKTKIMYVIIVHIYVCRVFSHRAKSVCVCVCVRVRMCVCVCVCVCVLESV